MNEIPKPLVSVVVITYNSARYVVETLDSIYAQTYANLELIISDDCSTDRTIRLCEQWLDTHKSRFIRTQVLTVPTNTGVSANGNRGRSACQGEWVKSIAGDDLLLPNCIEEFVSYVQSHPGEYFVFSRMQVFGENKQQVADIAKVLEDNYHIFTKSAAEQYEQLLKQNCIPAPAFFFNRNKFQQLGLTNDERIRFLEDYPKWLTITKMGIRLMLVDKELVKYRIHNNSISTRISLPTPLMYKSNQQFYYYYQFPVLYARDMRQTIEDIIEKEYRVYNNLYTSYMQIRQSYAYRIGKIIMRPWAWIKKHKQ